MSFLSLNIKIKIFVALKIRIFNNNNLKIYKNSYNVDKHS